MKRISSEDILEAMNGLDETLIEEAALFRMQAPEKKAKRIAFPGIRGMNRAGLLLAAAACVVIALSMGSLLRREYTQEAAYSTAPAVAESMADEKAVTSGGTLTEEAEEALEEAAPAMEEAFPAEEPAGAAPAEAAPAEASLTAETPAEMEMPAEAAEMPAKAAGKETAEEAVAVQSMMADEEAMAIPETAEAEAAISEESEEADATDIAGPAAAGKAEESSVLASILEYETGTDAGIGTRAGTNAAARTDEAARTDTEEGTGMAEERTLTIDGTVCRYRKIALEEEGAALLSGSRGDRIGSEERWYRISGEEGSDWLIFEETDGTYTLWQRVEE